MISRKIVCGIVDAALLMSESLPIDWKIAPGISRTKFYKQQQNWHIKATANLPIAANKLSLNM